VNKMSAFLKSDIKKTEKQQPVSWTLGYRYCLLFWGGWTRILAERLSVIAEVSCGVPWSL